MKQFLEITAISVAIVFALATIIPLFVAFMIKWGDFVFAVAGLK
jgi:hypothetical protein